MSSGDGAFFPEIQNSQFFFPCQIQIAVIFFISEIKFKAVSIKTYLFFGFNSLVLIRAIGYNDFQYTINWLGTHFTG